MVRSVIASRRRSNLEPSPGSRSLRRFAPRDDGALVRANRQISTQPRPLDLRAAQLGAKECDCAIDRVGRRCVPPGRGAMPGAAIDDELAPTAQLACQAYYVLAGG